MLAFDGNDVPVSAMPVDGTFPTGTTQWEKRNLALEIPVWVPDLCIQCGKCIMVCPHAVIRQKIFDDKLLSGAPETFKHMPSKYKEFSKGMTYSIQVAPEDCTGCELCVEACPAKDKTQAGRKALNMEPQPALQRERKQELGLLHENSRPRPQADQSIHHQEFATASPAVRILRRLLGLRRELLTSNFSRSFSVTGQLSRMQPAVPPSMAATYPRRRGQRIALDAGRPGRTRCLKITRNSASACA